VARTRRYHYPGCFYHVMLRGNHGQEIFFSDHDRHHMCFLLQEGVERYSHRVHAFCFMNNHIHLLIQIGNIPLSKVMHNLAFRYSQRINRKYDTTGHLFQGRYKAILVQDGVYFMRLLRYIHRNPVRAGIVDSPENYSWSSHNSYVSQNRIDWLTRDFGLSKFASSREEAVFRYSMYVSEIESEEELEALRGDFKDSQILGDDEYIHFMKNQSPMETKNSLSINTIMELVCNEFQIERELLISKNKSKKASFARAILCKIAVKAGGIPLTVLGKYLNRDPSTICGFLENFENKHKKLKKEGFDLEVFIEKALQTPIPQA
jgi:putative transposase